mmetsp:Transcript_52349/g.122818  ORF Transcript_52349/g.122818 Transcript_52349/m.122818 type:complete len:219 (+) Transcript_52349:543-1199(+)
MSLLARKRCKKTLDQTRNLARCGQGRSLRRVQGETGILLLQPCKAAQFTTSTATISRRCTGTSCARCMGSSGATRRWMRLGASSTRPASSTRAPTASSSSSGPSWRCSGAWSRRSPCSLASTALPGRTWASTCCSSQPSSSLSASGPSASRRRGRFSTATPGAGTRTRPSSTRGGGTTKRRASTGTRWGRASGTPLSSPSSASTPPTSQAASSTCSRP